MNVPITDGLVDDDLRIEASLSTLRWLVERKASVTVCSHLGRPAGQQDDKYSIKPVKERLLEVLPNLDVLENLRFNPGEKSNDESFVQYLLSGAVLDFRISG